MPVLIEIQDEKEFITIRLDKQTARILEKNLRLRDYDATTRFGIFITRLREVIAFLKGYDND